MGVTQCIIIVILSVMMLMMTMIEKWDCYLCYDTTMIMIYQSYSKVFIYRLPVHCTFWAVF